MHHMYDETPDEMNQMAMKLVPIALESNAIYAHHIGHAEAAGASTEQVNQTQLRQRGYKVGSLKTGPEEEDKYYKQPGHPLSDKGGRFPVKDPNELMKSKSLQQSTLKSLQEKIKNTAITKEEKAAIQEIIDDLGERKNLPPIMTSSSDDGDKLDRRSYKR